MTDVKMPEPFGYVSHIAHVFLSEEGGFVRCEAQQSKMFNTGIFNADQLKQYGDDRAREALEMAADTCDSTMYIEGDGTISKYGPMTHANVEIQKCADAIRALAKETK